MSWIGRKKLAFVPVYRPNAHPPDQVPPDWAEQITRRVLFDPDPTSGADRSLRAYIRAVSSGLADLDVVVMPVCVVDRQDVEPAALEAQLGAQLRDQGVDAAAIVMLGGPGAGTNAGFWSRFVMLEGVGVWAMEFMHALTGFADLYPFGGNMGAFDEMACSCATHPSAYTKAALGWLDAAAIAQHDRRAVAYDLHAVGLVQPPPSGRAAAVRAGDLMVEGRLRVDAFDAGIPSEGVIVYRIQTSDPLGHAQGERAPIDLLTGTALDVGEHIATDAGYVVRVTGTVPGGFTVLVEDLNANFEPGELLVSRDGSGSGTARRNNLSVIGLGGWQDFVHLCSGGDGILYAVNTEGQLLFYRDTTGSGGTGVIGPSVIGRGGWQQMRFLFSGGNGSLYAVDGDGRLLFYRDTARDGTGDVNTPSVIGQGGWQRMRFLFPGGEGILYAVDADGRLLFYRDTTQDGTGDVNTPSVIGQGGWQQFSRLFADASGLIYAVEPDGQMLLYRDFTRDGSGDVNSPIALDAGWPLMKHMFDGGPGTIYAVPQ